MGIIYGVLFILSFIEELVFIPLSLFNLFFLYLIIPTILLRIKKLHLQNVITCLTDMRILCCIYIHSSNRLTSFELTVLLVLVEFLCVAFTWWTAFPIENTYFPAYTAKYDKSQNFSFNLLSSFSALLYLIWSASEALCHLEVQWCV